MQLHKYGQKAFRRIEVFTMGFPYPQGPGGGRGRGRGGGWGGGFRGGGGRGGGGGPPWMTGAPTIDVPPPPSGAFRVAAPLMDNRGLDSTIAPMLARAPFIAFIDIAGGRVAALNIQANPVASFRGGAGIALAEALASAGCRVVLAPQVGPQAIGAMQRLGIEVRFVQPGIPLIQALRQAGLLP